MYESVWNSKLTAFLGTIFQDGDTAPSTVYARLIKQATSTVTASSSQASVTPYALRGQDVPGILIGYAASPDKSRVFMFMNENGTGAGYISNFDGTGMTKLFSTPLTQVNVDWPTDTAITIVTKGSAKQNGFMYSVSTKTGVWTKVLGPVSGLSAIMSHDGKYVLMSRTDGDGINTGIYSTSSGTSTDAIIRTLADKCAWGNAYKDTFYCAVPTQLTSATYPDDWYKGVVANTDKLWQIDATTDDTHLISSITDKSDRVIDAFNLGLDAKDKYLFFMNKNDLSLWSLDLVRSQ